MSSRDVEIAELVKTQVDKRVSEALKELSEGRLYNAKRGKSKKTK